MNPITTARTTKVLGLAFALLAGGCGRKPSPSLPPETSVTFAVLRSSARLEVPESDAMELPRTLSLAQDSLRTLAKPFDLGDEKSELSRVNQLAHNVRLPISRDLRWALIQARRLHRNTDKAFDVTDAPLRVIHGFEGGSSPSTLPPEVISATLGVVGFDLIDLAEDALYFRAPRVRLDFHGMLDGYLLDRTILDLRQSGVLNLRLQMGSTARALGYQAPEEAWNFVVPSPQDPDRPLATIPLFDQRAASYRLRDARTITIDGTRYSDVLDPRNGRSAERYAVAIVTAPFATAAQALSRTLLLTGPAGVTNLLAHYPGSSALILQDQPEPLLYRSEDFEVDWIDPSWRDLPQRVIGSPPAKDVESIPVPTPEA
jgi:thiamine biosynthesis lipoprotein